MAKFVMESFIKYGEVRRGYLGVGIQDLTEDLAKEFDYDKTEGALVTQVVEGSPADKAGLKRGDIIVKYNGKKVKGANHLKFLVGETSPGTKVKIEVFRDGKRKVLTVKVGEYSEEKVLSAEEIGVKKFGIRVANLTDRIRRQLGIAEGIEGVVITAVKINSTGYEAGLREGDIIVEVNKKPVKNTAQFKKVVSRIKKGRKVLFALIRDDAFFYKLVQAQ